jgi:hypothetical protein
MMLMNLVILVAVASVLYFYDLSHLYSGMNFPQSFWFKLARLGSVTDLTAKTVAATEFSYCHGFCG